MKIVVIGNCQARPVASILQKTGEFEILDTIILHLASNSEALKHNHIIETADFIITQNTADNFAVDHLRSSALKDAFGEKVIIWPNIFYAGQQPFIRYFTVNGIGRLFGPLEAMHDLRIFWDWWEKTYGASIRPEISDHEFSSVMKANSLSELKHREQACDVSISDVIEEHGENEKLFFTFNHPRLRLLNEVCRRILSNIGTNKSVIHENLDDKEPLSRFIVPSAWATPEGPRETYVGNDFTLETGGRLIMRNERKNYTVDELRDAFFQCYDHAKEDLKLENIRFTPNLKISPA